MPEATGRVDDAGRDSFDRTWNAACGLPSSRATRDLVGDRALRHVLQFHGLAMNGDLHHAISSGADIRHHAVAGYRRFGLDAVADVVVQGMELLDHATGDVLDESLDSPMADLDSAYNRLLPSDSVLFNAVRAYWHDHREEFVNRE
jgi:hypothetical protein